MTFAHIFSCGKQPFLWFFPENPRFPAKKQDDFYSNIFSVLLFFYNVSLFFSIKNDIFIHIKSFSAKIM